MTFNKKLFTGALVVAGLVACGGEAQNPADEAGRVESRVDNPTVTITTAMNESASCYSNGLTYYETGVECWLAANVTHQYHEGYTVTFAPTGSKQFIPYNGLFSGGPLAGNQTLYVGPGNGTATFKGGTTISIAGVTLQERMVNMGQLAQDTCLKKADGTWVACAAEKGLEFWAPPNGAHLQGYLVRCTPSTTLTCQQ
jgi:hypothetical protein